MIKTNLFQLLLTCLLFSTTLTVSAQVTIGSNIEPEKGMLLELKTRLPGADNVTIAPGTGGGLGFPRVELVNRTTLEPFVSTSDADWLNDADATNPTHIKRKHAGTVVYNVYTSPSTETDKDLIFLPGLYVWDGEEWNALHTGKKAFYMPPCDIELAGVGAGRTFNLYEQYAQLFTDGNPMFVSNNTSLTHIPVLQGGRVYQASELEYVVAYYDSEVITIDGIDNDGTMHYSVVSMDLDPGRSFLTVIMVVK